MTTATYHHPSPRETLADLFGRLERVTAAGASMQSLANAKDTPATMLADALEALEHDLLLAAREAESAKARIKR